MDIRTLAKNPTFRDLLELIGEMPEERLNDRLQIYDIDQDEFLPVASIGEVTNSDVIADGATILSISEMAE